MSRRICEYLSLALFEQLLQAVLRHSSFANAKYLSGLTSLPFVGESPEKLKRREHVLFRT